MEETMEGNNEGTDWYIQKEKVHEFIEEVWDVANKHDFPPMVTVGILSHIQHQIQNEVYERVQGEKKDD